MAYGRHVKRLRRLFTRREDGWGERAGPCSAATLAPSLASGRLRAKACHLPMAACIDGATVVPGTGARESIEHLHMKRAACTWMRSEGASDAAEEVIGYGGKFDAYSAGLDWIIEVGNSDIGKLVDAILDEDHPRFTLIPYQPIRWRNGSLRRLIATDFRWDDDLCADLGDQIRVERRAWMARSVQSQRARLIEEAQARKAARQGEAKA